MMYITAYLSLCEFQQNKSAFEYRLEKYAQKTQRSNSCIHKIVIINEDLKKWRVTKKILKTAFTIVVVLIQYLISLVYGTEARF